MAADGGRQTVAGRRWPADGGRQTVDAVAAAGEVRYLTRHGTTPGTAWRAAVRLAAGLAFVTGLAGLAACSSAPAPGATGTSCGTTRTAANVLVDIRVERGSVSCAGALRTEQDYATMLKDGEVQGNGGGAPVKVDGWTCEGYATPVAVRTGDASECHTATAEVVAVIVVPASTAPSAG